MLALAGFLLGIVGWLDVALLWVPLKIGAAEWEFGTVSTTLEALPLATIGLALVVTAALAKGWRVRLRVAGWFAAAVLVGLAAALVLYLLTLPLAWKGVPPASLPVLKKAIAKTLLLALAYLAIYGVFGVTVLRRLRANRLGEGA